mgnify:CR=1 FL=1
MVETLMPYGAIAEKCVKSIIQTRHGRYGLVDDYGNHWRITQFEFERLKKMGIQETKELVRR